MKSARELFEELGYDYFNNGLRITYQNYEISECKLIEFNLKQKKMWLSDDSEEVVMLSYKEIKAINKQIEELHWNDTIINFDVKLDGKKVMEAMRGGNNA